MQRKISQSIRMTQAYRRQDFLVAPDNFPMYTESSSFSKIQIPNSSDIRISQIFIAPNTYRSKQALNNPVSLVFVFANNLESLFTDGLTKIIDPGVGQFTQTVAPNDDFPLFENEPDINFDLPKVVAYYEIPEFADFPVNAVSNYPEGNIAKLLRDPENKIQKHIADIYMLQSMSPLQPDTEILFTNSNNFESLYIFGFLPALQKTDVIVTARINFLLEY